jgi:uncharacterized membrane protein YecN with MAPEG domain
MTIDLDGFPAIAGLTAAAILLLQMILMIHVGRVRGATETLFGEGGERMQQAIRVHGNLAENSGLFVAALALLEMAGAATWGVATLCGVFVAARIAHAIGLSRTTGVNPGRFMGALGTLLVGVVCALWLGWLAIGALTG